jgi:methionine aminotransferase
MAPESIMARFRLMHRYQVFSVNLPVQLALSDYLHGKTTWFPYGKEFQSRRDLFNSLLSDSKFTIYPAQGGYFQVLSYENVSKENDVDFSLRLAQDYSILALPMSFYYHDTFDSKQLRVCFGKSEEDLTKAVNILKSV